MTKQELEELNAELDKREAEALERFKSLTPEGKRLVLKMIKALCEGDTETEESLLKEMGYSSWEELREANRALEEQGA